MCYPRWEGDKVASILPISWISSINLHFVSFLRERYSLCKNWKSLSFSGFSSINVHSNLNISKFKCLRLTTIDGVPNQVHLVNQVLRLGI